jgi:hypothetical protein
VTLEIGLGLGFTVARLYITVIHYYCSLKLPINNLSSLVSYMISHAVSF